MDELLAERSVEAVDGVALDLGVSSMQLDEAERGFSLPPRGPARHAHGARRPDRRRHRSTTPEAELADIIFRFGDERHSRRVARAIVADRASRAVHHHHGSLAEPVRRAVPRSKDGIDPATRTFQALRIAVNDELGELDRGPGRGRKAAARRRPAGRGLVPFPGRPRGEGLPAASQRRARRGPAATCRPAAGPRPFFPPARQRSRSCRRLPRSPPTPAPARPSCASPSAPPRRPGTPSEAMHEARHRRRLDRAADRRRRRPLSAEDAGRGAEGESRRIAAPDRRGARVDPCAEGRVELSQRSGAPARPGRAPAVDATRPPRPGRHL